MSDTIKIDVQAEGASQKLDEVRDAVGGINEELGKNESANAGAAKETSSFTDTAAKLAVGLAALKAIMLDTLAAYAEQDELNGQLQRSLRKTGATVEDAAKSYKKAQDAFTNNTKFGLGIAAQTAAYSKLTDKSKDAKQSLSDLSLAVDIQAQENIDLASATDKLIKARQGDTGALKELGILTKDTEAKLASITDETLRAELAIQFLTEAYQGAAVENAGLADELASTDAQIEKVKVSTGKLVGALWTGGNSLVNGILEVSGTLPQGTTTLEAFAGGMDILADNTLSATSEIKAFLSEIKSGDLLAVISKTLKGGLISGETEKELIKIRDRALDNQAKQAGKLNVTIKEMGDVEVGGAKESLSLALKRQKIAAKSLKTVKATKKVIENTAVFETGGFAEEEDTQKAEAAAQKKLDLEIQLQEIANKRAATTEEALLIQLDLESQLASVRGASLDPELESLRITEAQLKAGQRLAGLNEAQRVKVETKILEEKAAAHAPVGTAIDLSAQGFSGAAELFNAGERTKAGISGGMETARAIAAGAAGNIPGAIGHGLAAAQFFAVAASSGGGSTAPPSGGSTASPSASFSGTDTEERALANQPEARGTGSLNIVNNYNSAFPPSPTQERELREAQVRDARRTV